MGEAFEWGTALRELGGWGVASVCMFVIYRMWLYTKELHSAIQKLGLESVKTMAEGNKTLETVGNHVKKNSDNTEAVNATVISIKERLQTVVDTTTKTSDRVMKLCGREEA
jgi:hypothetical protein